MAQVLRPDIIGDLSKTSGTLLTLAAGSYVTVGGQQYTNSAALTINTATTGAGGLDTGTITASSTYFVYGVVSAQALALVASLSAVSPTGFTGYKQIGAFQTDAAAAVDFVFAIAQAHGEPLKDVPGVETRTSQLSTPTRNLRNYIINGAFDIWQRGVGPTAIPSTEGAAGYFLADRFSSRDEVTAGGASANSLRSTDVPTFTQSGFNFNYSLEIDITTATGGAPASGDSARVKYIVEGYDVSNFIRSNFRVQFWVKSNKIGLYSLVLSNAGATRRYIATYTINTTDTWELKEIDFPGETTGTWNTTNGEGLNIIWTHVAGSASVGTPSGTWNNPNPVGAASGQVNLYDNTANYWRMTGVALYSMPASPGLSIPFVRAGVNLQQEISMCQRYFQRLNSEMNAANGLVLYSQGIIYTATTGTMLYKPMVPMRTQPTVATPNLTNLGVFNNAGVMIGLTSLNIQTGDGFFQAISFATAGGLTGGNVAAIGNKLAVAADITFDAEL